MRERGPTVIWAGLNTLHAGWLTLRLAKWLGQKVVTRDELGTVVTLVYWRGRAYLIDFQEGG